MAHFAKISEANVVLTVVTLADSDMLDGDGAADESVGQAYLQLHNNWPAHLWIQTSYNTKAGKYYNNDNTVASDQSKAFRGNYAGIGYTWDKTNEIFWPKQPYPSWVKSDFTWISPIGAAPDLTSEQETQNSLNNNHWEYQWNESAYQADNNAGWVLVDTLA